MERYINDDASYPVVGRSEAYRIGQFHHLSDSALRHNLASEQTEGAVRSALTALVEKFLGNEDNFLGQWLSVGVYGHQPHLGDSYINTGSTYFCTTVLKHLGLPADSTYWTVPGEPNVSMIIWSGEDHELDEAYDGESC